jgi:hypothetical protein
LMGSEVDGNRRRAAGEECGEREQCEASHDRTLQPCRGRGGEGGHEVPCVGHSTARAKARAPSMCARRHPPFHPYGRFRFPFFEFRGKQ